LGGVFDGYASGTTSALSGLHIVGECGPELVRFKGGERVYNNNDTMKILSGNGEKRNTFNVTFNNLQDTSAYTMMSQLRDYNRQMAINGIL
jgi:phage-related tail protein